MAHGETGKKVERDRGETETRGNSAEETQNEQESANLDE
tara:strand:- start:11837 stop:11953 length:117 start_codon:yes stop_codon:yes gene_type:complete